MRKSETKEKGVSGRNETKRGMLTKGLNSGGGGRYYIGIEGKKLQVLTQACREGKEIGGRLWQ